MELSSLTAVSPIDGRYRNVTQEISGYFSEFALIKYRLMVEIEYFIALHKIPLPQLDELEDEAQGRLRNIYLDFSHDDAFEVKEIEKNINHDVKAVEYFIKKKLREFGIDRSLEFVHFGLTRTLTNVFCLIEPNTTFTTVTLASTLSSLRRSQRASMRRNIVTGFMSVKLAMHR